MDKKTLHIISHSHWDREWYLPFEKHRARLVELVDALIDTLDTNPNFKSFHFDGQVVPLEDYLEVRPQMKDKLRKHIKENKIFIGPWYVLQDEYLISSEANVRNMLVGLHESRKYGAPLMVGYFPDSFGNISQAPQILNGFGIDCCAFGRGVVPVAANNTIQTDKNVQKRSEFKWYSPDGSSVSAVLFANWYHNAMEIPSEHDKAVARIGNILQSTAAVSGTPHLLGMNGCDHQPVQTDIGDIIADIRSAFPDVQILHSNFKDYMQAIRAYEKEFPPIYGELAGQNTDGYTTLINTASARVYMKQANHKNQAILEKQTEPLSVLSYLNGDDYRQDLINHAWREILKNHAHDSICGCSIDDVHRECMSRFEKSTATAESVRDSAATYLSAHVTTANTACERAIAVFNPNGYPVTQTVTAFADLALEDDTPAEEFGLFTSEGRAVPCDVEDRGRTFTYTLPRNKFRQPRYVRRLALSFTAEEIPSIGFDTFYLKKGKQAVPPTLSLHGLTAENRFIRVEVNPNGTFNLLDKATGKQMKDLGCFEESGDCGDEYFYRIPQNDMVYTTLDGRAEISAVQQKSKVVFTVRNSMTVPAKSDKEGRSAEMVTVRFETTLTIGEQAKTLEIKTVFDNTAEDHRIRVLFPNGIQTDVVYADAQYELIERNILPNACWKNPDNSQRQQAFVMLQDNDTSMVVANRGLLEYEVLRDGQNTIALTLLRGVGFLGDWGVFPTPEAQCLGKNTAEYAVGISGADNRELRKLALSYSTGELFTFQLPADQKGEVADRFAPFSFNSDNTIISAVKKAEEDGGVIVRFYNPTNTSETVSLTFTAEVKGRLRAFETNLNEEVLRELEMQNNKVVLGSPAKKITTIKFDVEKE